MAGTSWIGPFLITALIGKAAVKSDLSRVKLKIHNVFLCVPYVTYEVLQVRWH